MAEPPCGAADLVCGVGHLSWCARAAELFKSSDTYMRLKLLD